MLGHPFSPRRHHMHPTRVLALGFLSVIVAGTLLLMLPIATSSGKSVGFLTALFTATSCVCVTGLTVVEVGLVYSGFGHFVMLCLIQIGGLGFMTAAALLLMAIGKRITLRNRMTIAEGLNEGSIAGQVRLVRSVVLMTAIIELAGAILLAFKFVPTFGLGKGLWYSVFHAISAFCNAGFDILGNGNSIVNLNSSPYVLLVLAALIILGGLGFSVINDVIKRWRYASLHLHSKIVILMTAVLLAAGTVLFFLNEQNNPGTMGEMALGDKVVNSFFQSVTLRTCGFASVNQGLLSNGSLLLCMLLMFIGASPASTGGGIKTTTAFAMVLQVISVVRGRNDLEFAERKLPVGTGRRAVAIIFIAAGILVLMVTIVCFAEMDRGFSATEILYECISAFATVGNSTGITASLTPVSKLVLIVGMFCGRVGPVTLAVAFAGRSGNEGGAHYPEERIMVG
jgi:trk system potassium uptake protein TrkH